VQDTAERLRSRVAKRAQRDTSGLYRRRPWPTSLRQAEVTDLFEGCTGEVMKGAVQRGRELT